MYKIYFILILSFGLINISNAEVNRIIAGNKDAKITIIAYESLTCSHCADFHREVYPQLKKDYIDTGLAKIEFRHFPLDVAAFNALYDNLYGKLKDTVDMNTTEQVNHDFRKLIAGIKATS